MKIGKKDSQPFQKGGAMKLKDGLEIDRLLSLKEVAEITGLAEITLYQQTSKKSGRWRKDWVLRPAIRRLGRAVRFSERDVRVFLETGSVTGKDADRRSIEAWFVDIISTDHALSIEYTKQNFLCTSGVLFPQEVG